MYMGEVPKHTQGGPSSKMLGSEKSRMSNLTQLFCSWATEVVYVGYWPGYVVTRILKRSTEIIFLPRPRILISEGTKGKVPSLVSISVDWLCFREFCLEKDSKATTWLRRQECHDWLAMSAQVQDGVLWLVCLEIYTAAFRREICDSLCQRQGMFL